MSAVDTVNSACRKVPVWPLYVVGLLPIPGLFMMAATGQLGVEPIEALEHRYGMLALQLLVAGLAVSTIRRFVGVNLIRFRRAIGLLAFYYVLAHVAVWLFLDVRSVEAVWLDIMKRPYITVGMLGLLCLIPLAATSNDWSCRTLGAGWRKLHRLTYPAVSLSCLHFVMMSKGMQVEPFAYLGVALALIAMRYWPVRLRWRPA